MYSRRLNVIKLALSLVFAGFFLGLPVSAFCGEGQLQRFESLRIRMGIPVKIIVYADQQVAAIQAIDAAFKRIRDLDRILSDYDPDSENSRLCQHFPAGDPVSVSGDLFRVLQAARTLNINSEGAFDVTIGPVSKLWRIARRKRALPDSAALKLALQNVGNDLVDLDSHRQTVALKRRGMQLDFGGIAKGFAADEALKVLKEHGFPIALIAMAGDIAVGDPPPNQPAWKVEVEDKTLPASPDRSPLIVLLKNQAISTSGDTYQFLEIDGVRYSHIVDPKTGMGMTTPGSVTIIAPTAMQADGLASAVVILGPDRGMKLLEKSPGTLARIVRLESNNTRSVTVSPSWETYVAP